MCQIQWMSQSSGQVSWRRRVCRFVPMTSSLSSRSADQRCNDIGPCLLYLRPVKGMAAVFFYFVSSRSPEVRTYHRWVLKDPPLHCYPCHAVSAEVQYHTNGQMNLDTNTNSGLNVNMLEYFAHVYCLLMKRTISMWFAVKLTINPYPLWGMRNTPPHFSSLCIFQSPYHHPSLTTLSYTDTIDDGPIFQRAAWSGVKIMQCSDIFNKTFVGRTIAHTVWRAWRERVEAKMQT